MLMVSGVVSCRQVLGLDYSPLPVRFPCRFVTGGRAGRWVPTGATEEALVFPNAGGSHPKTGRLPWRSNLGASGNSHVFLSLMLSGADDDAWRKKRPRGNGFAGPHPSSARSSPPARVRPSRVERVFTVDGSW